MHITYENIHKNVKRILLYIKIYNSNILGYSQYRLNVFFSIF